MLKQVVHSRRAAQKIAEDMMKQVVYIPTGDRLVELLKQMAGYYN
jgi:hypothetical protein